MNLIKRVMSCRQEKELEIARATAEAAKRELEEQKLLTRYVAEMSNVYLPPEEVETNVSDSFTNESNV